LGLSEARLSLKDQDLANPLSPYANHDQALQAMLVLIQPFPLAAVGHRVVHGGEYFSDSVRITESVLGAIRACIPLAPLHNPANILGIETLMRDQPNIPNVAVFDTAFHQSLPERAYRYALPSSFYHEDHIRRYGFHGTSFRYVHQAWSQAQNHPQASVIIAHLGNGASIAAIEQGQSVDTSMGLTPLEGLVMGTRIGDIDPGIVFHLARHKGMSLDSIEAVYNQGSGLLGLSGLSNDCRRLEEAEGEGHAGAQLALSVFCYQLARKIASYWPSLSRIDALIFTGGIGENSHRIRQEVLSLLSNLGISAQINPPPRGQMALISAAQSRIPVWVVPTNEEAMIAEDTWRVLMEGTH
jgi:acetate kinase